MDARAALLVGTGTAVAAAVAMTCGFALTSASALADKAGSPVADAVIIVHGHPDATAAPAPAATAPETVAAPAPKDIAAPPVTTQPRSEQTSTTKTQAPDTRSDAKKADTAQNDAKAADAAKAAAASKAAAQAKAEAAAKKSEAAKQTAAGRETAHTGGKVSDATAARIRDRLEQLAKKWQERLGEHSRYTNNVTKNSVDSTEWNSGSGHPRLRSGSQKGQSHSSPDSGD
ncbi:hypothetical protein ET475_13710 [Microbacterium protaetiae]|uniref:Uncharacterized protein n=1 Tax=Microbacterium protaetiae TaxID=2509458 RepID=A0A4P6EF15_9MICO|nr:hypothetical protein [Microbacterium protaetiae]QAY60940.1 hypothetical protein ET475_13710 [Microbacterium protaetiae]